MKRIMIQTLLYVSGAGLVVIGFAALFQPHALFATNDVALGTDPNLLSEVRSPGGLLLASGFIIVLGAIRRNLAGFALAMSALVYGAYGFSRLVSIAVDGMPATSLTAAMTAELIVGALSLLALHSHRAGPSRTAFDMQVKGERS